MCCLNADDVWAVVGWSSDLITLAERSNSVEVRQWEGINHGKAGSLVSMDHLMAWSLVRGAGRS